MSEELHLGPLPAHHAGHTPSHQPTHHEDDHGFHDLGEYAQIIIDYRWVILGVTLAALICSTIYFSLQPNFYSAEVKILVERVQNQPRARQELIMPSAEINDEDYYGTQIEILTGRRIEAMARNELGVLSADYKLNAQQLRGTHILSLAVESSDPQVVAKVANTYANVYVRESAKESLFITQQMLKFLPEQNEVAGMPAVDAASYVASEAAASTGFDKKQYAESLADVSEDIVVQKMKAEKLELESKLQEFSQRYKPNHPAVVEAQERLVYIEGQLKERMGKILTNVRANLSGEVAITNVKVLEEAQAPAKPAGPNRPLNILLSSLIGFLTVASSTILYETLFQRIRTVKDIYAGVGIPFLGYVPLFRSVSRRQKMFTPYQEEEQILTELIRKNTVLADSVVSVRTHILFTVPYEQSRRIMITSAIPGEGKTTVAALLALSLTALGRKIAFVDADMRRPTSHNYLGLRNEKGLSEYLSGKAEIKDIIRSMEGSNLAVVTAGARTQNPAELLASERFRELLDYLSNEYDRVVIDVPPVLYIPDALIVAKYVRTGILICGAGMVQKKVVRSVKDKFDAIHHSLIGVVINRADYEGQKYRYNYYHAYRDYYVKRKIES